MTYTEKVATYLRTCDLRKARQPVVAHALHMSARTLCRSLEAEGVSFQSLLDTERQRRCDNALAQNPSIRGKRLMADLGYTELNSFYRAYARWTGKSFRERRHTTATNFSQSPVGASNRARCTNASV